MSEHIRITRGEIIDALVQSAFDDIEMNMEKLDYILRSGWQGYEYTSDEALIAEYQEYISEEDPDSVVITLEDE